jgi:MYXO-CTERM domain-containing protein
MKPRRLGQPTASAFLLASLFAGMAHADWQPFGPAPLGDGNGGRVTSIAPHPTDNDTFYVGSATGGVWKYQGGTWTALTDKMPHASIGAVAIDPKNPDVVYAGSGEANGCLHCFYGVGLYKSTDAGANWTILAEDTFGGRTFSKLLVSPANTQILFATITQPGKGYPGGFTAGKGYPNFDGPVGVFRSANAGSTWSQLTSGIPAQAASDVVMAPGDPNTLYAAIGLNPGDPSNGVYKTTNGGDTWTRLAGGLPTENIGRISLAIAPSRPSRIYAQMARPNNEVMAGGATLLGIYVTDDAGMTWTAYMPSNHMGQQGGFNNVVAVDPANPDTAYFGGTNLLRTENGGMTTAAQNSLHVDYHALVYTVAGDLLVGQDGGVNRRAVGTTSFTSLNAGFAINQLYPGISLHPTLPDFILGGFQDNGSHLRGSMGWRRVGGGDGGYTALHPANPDVMFAESQNATSLTRSTNGGQSFSSASSGIASTDRTAFYNVIVPTEDFNVFLLATHRIYKSTNQGASWMPISGDITSGAPYAVRALAIPPNHSQTVWAATTEDQILVSEDGGVTFTKKLDAPGWRRTTREISVPPWSDRALYVGVSRYATDQVRMTNDLGDTWTTIDGDLPDVPVNAIEAAVVRGQKMVFVGTDRGVYFTCNDGLRWSRLGETLPNTVVNDIRYDATFNRVVASTFGRGVWFIEEPTGGGDCLDAGIIPGRPDANNDAAETGGESDASADIGGQGGGGGAAGASSGAAGQGATGGSSVVDPGQESGCSCRVVAPSGRNAAFGWGLLGAVALLRRRRGVDAARAARRVPTD